MHVNREENSISTITKIYDDRKIIRHSHRLSLYQTKATRSECSLYVLCIVWCGVSRVYSQLGPLWPTTLHPTDGRNYIARLATVEMFVFIDARMLYRQTHVLHTLHNECAGWTYNMWTICICFYTQRPLRPRQLHENQFTRVRPFGDVQFMSFIYGLPHTTPHTTTVQIARRGMVFWNVRRPVCVWSWGGVVYRENTYWKCDCDFDWWKTTNINGNGTISITAYFTPTVDCRSTAHNKVFIEHWSRNCSRCWPTSVHMYNIKYLINY